MNPRPHADTPLPSGTLRSLTLSRIFSRALHSVIIDRPLASDLPSDTPMTRFSVRRNCRLAAGLAALLALGVSGAQSAMPRGERHEVRHQIDRLEDHWRDAILNDNVSAMDALLASDFMAITPDGTLQSKDELLASLRSGQLHVKSLEVSDRKVRFYGSTALVTSRAKITGTNPAGDMSGSYRYTRVYVRDASGNWRIVSFEASRIRDTDDHK